MNFSRINWYGVAELILFMASTIHFIPLHESLVLQRLPMIFAQR